MPPGEPSWVAKHEVDVLTRYDPEGFAGVSRGMNLMTGASENPLECMPIKFFVVYDEDVRLAQGWDLRRAEGGGPQCRGRTFKAKESPREDVRRGEPAIEARWPETLETPPGFVGESRERLVPFPIRSRQR